MRVLSVLTLIVFLAVFKRLPPVDLLPLCCSCGLISCRYRSFSEGVFAIDLPRGADSGGSWGGEVGLSLPPPPPVGDRTGRDSHDLGIAAARVINPGSCPPPSF
ncbi:hypothetical protein DFJ73DRAFT_852154 [Zopfochytrium polystomum]|nr:hypothetical protein DFJ73DRAFT_852154 [Zopfochytrium polystomum]